MSSNYAGTVNSRGGLGYLIDEESDPSLRAILGTLLTHARKADLAIARIRLAGIDLSASELGGMARCRLLIGALDLNMLDIAPSARQRIPSLAAFLASGKLEIRTCRARTWGPDFSVYSGLPPRPAFPTGSLGLFGSHYFYKYPTSGPSFTTLLTDPGSVRRAALRFARLWDESDDVLPVLRESLDQVFNEMAAG